MEDTLEGIKRSIKSLDEQIQSQKEEYEKRLDNLNFKYNRVLIEDMDEQIKTTGENYKMGLITIKERIKFTTDIMKHVEKNLLKVKY